MVAAWEGDLALQAAVHALPEALKDALAVDWSAAVPVLASATRLYVVGRASGLAVAQEIALKLKETCGLHAEAFSSAEVQHGPMAIVGPGFPVLCFAQDDRSGDATTALAETFRRRGARVWLAAPGARGEGCLPLPASPHPACTPLVALASFYKAANALALARGRDPDLPPHLRKVTRTR